ncbi:MAG: hypothetical protein NTV06_00905 [candidate division Zixibacteria bacterium]|nr:hypothetical protein [candidate division Zixibacteria bacterium]
MSKNDYSYQRKLANYILFILGLAFIGAIILSFIRTGYWYLIWIILLLTGLYFFVRWHAINTEYKCPKCGNVFRISTFIDFISPHFPNKKWLKCPSCGRRSWCPEE